MRFQNVLKLNDKEFITVLPAQQIVDMYRNGILRYNKDIQRGIQIKIKRGQIEEIPVFSQLHVKKIKEAILNDEFFVSLLTFNVLNKGNSKLFYYENERVLEVRDDHLDIADGYHRIRALVDIDDSNSNHITNYDLSQLVFPIKITHFTLEEIQMHFYQSTLGLKISSSRAEFFNSKAPANIIVKHLMQSSLKDKVEVTKNVINKKDIYHIVTFATLVNAINMVYNPTSVQDIQPLYKYLDEFFTELFKLSPVFTDYKERLSSRENSLIAENFMFYGYIAISKVLKDYPNWKELMPLILQIDMDKDSPQWLGVIIKKGRDDKKIIINSSDTRRKMIYMCTEIMKQLIAEHFQNDEDSVTEIVIDEENDADFDLELMSNEDVTEDNE